MASPFRLGSSSKTPGPRTQETPVQGGLLCVILWRQNCRPGAELASKSTHSSLPSRRPLAVCPHALLPRACFLSHFRAHRSQLWRPSIPYFAQNKLSCVAQYRRYHLRRVSRRVSWLGAIQNTPGLIRCPWRSFGDRSHRSSRGRKQCPRRTVIFPGLRDGWRHMTLSAVACPRARFARDHCRKAAFSGQSIFCDPGVTCAPGLSMTPKIQ